LIYYIYNIYLTPTPTPRFPPQYRSKGGAEGNKMNFEKKYDEVQGGGGDGDSSADEDFDDDEKADDDELKALEEEANMSVEELRKRAYGGDGGEESDAKKPKTDGEPA